MPGYPIPSENRTLGWQILKWTAEYLLQPDGPDAGTIWQFTPEQVRMIYVWYEIDDQGKFLRRRGVVRRMKGWGKDPFLAAIALVEACGPVRFGGWDEAGMPIGVMHPAPWVQIAAVSREQTKNTMTLFPGMISPKLKKEYQIDPGKEIIHVRNGAGRIEAVTSSPRSLEGGRPTLVVLNESHHWLANNDGLAMADVIRRNLGKSRDGDARSIEITNAHLPGEGSVAEATYDAIKSGDVAGVWYDALEAPPVRDLTDHDAVVAALEVARGDSYWVNPERLYEEINDPTTPEYIARRFYLNQVVVVDIDRWLPQGAWAKCTVKGAHIEKQNRVVLGFDGSYNGDATALVAASLDSPKPVVETVGLWERPLEKLAASRWKVPRADVMQCIRDACSKWEVMEVAVDPALWQTDLETLLEEGYPIVTFQQRGQDMLDATQRLYEVVTSGLLEHNEDPNLARHFANAYVKDPLRPRLQKEHDNSVHKIDLAVATIMAVHRAMEIALEDQYADVWFPSQNIRPDKTGPWDDLEDEDYPGMRAPKQLTEKDYLVPNQFNIGGTNAQVPAR